VSVRVAETLPVTLLLNAFALLLALSLSVPIAMLAASRPGGRLDRASGAVFDVIYATPAFVLGLALLLLFSVKLRWTSLFADPEEGLRGIALPCSRWRSPPWRP
jgi:ABC-type dipeptide/oligopeptide/nickel transport system permease component